MNNLYITILAYFIDRFFGEFSFIRHPVIYIGDLIKFFEKKFYKNSCFQGFLLVAFVGTITTLISITIEVYLSYLPYPLEILFSGIIASMFIAHNMLRASVLDVAKAPDLDTKREKIAMLVSRDTHNLDEHNIYKAAIETYAENLSDGVVAPIFYLLFFGLPGITFYKAVNTMDSMVGYRTQRYEKFGKFAAKLDDILNYIPARLTALIIMLRAKKYPLFMFYEDGSKHASPNAGHPITAMALALNIQLGGDTSYFGKIEKKATFGKNRKILTTHDIQKAVTLL